jgi:hypothetical protein
MTNVNDGSSSATEGDAASEPVPEKQAIKQRRTPAKKSPLMLVPAEERRRLQGHLMDPYGIDFLATSLPEGLVVGIASSREHLVHGKEGNTRETPIGKGFRSVEVSADGSRALCLIYSSVPDSEFAMTTTIVEVAVASGEKTTLWHGDLPAEPESRGMPFNVFYVGDSHIGINCVGSVLLMRRTGTTLEKAAEYSIADGREACHVMKPFYGGRVAIGSAVSVFLVFGFHGDEIALLAKHKAKKGFLVLQTHVGPYYAYGQDESRIEGIGALYRERFGEALPGDPK